MAEPARARASYQHEERQPYRVPSPASRQIERRRNSSNPSPKRQEAKVTRPKLKKVLVDNYLLILPVFALTCIGIVMVLSASSSLSPSGTIRGYRYIFQQVGCALVGVGLMLLFTLIDYHKLKKLSFPGVVLSLVLLVVVLFEGAEANGSRRWLMVGPIGIQVSEIAKFTVVIFAACVFATKGERIREFWQLIVPVVLVTLVAAGLILAEPDMGSAIILFVAVAIVMVLANAKPSHLLALGTAGGIASIFFAFSEPYRKARLLAFLSPWKDPQGSGYQYIQSFIAFGSGHIRGLGPGMSRQKFSYVPNAHTDFIFAIIGEEYGLLGTLFVLALTGMLVYAGFKIASNAPDNLGKLLAGGITGLIFIQAVVNMGGVTGLLPVTGVPLPFVSFGSASLLMCMASTGILLNISRQAYCKSSRMDDSR